MVDAGWENLLAAPHAGDHIVLLYEDELFLYEAVSRYLAGALQKDQPAVIIATPPHAEGFRTALACRGVDVLEALRNSKLMFLDARQTLATFQSEGWLDADAFRTVVGDLLRKAGAGGKSVLAYGEMVDLLYREGKRAQALQLEQLWNSLAKTHDFALLCAYRQAPFGAEAANAVTEIASTHSHLIPVRDYDRLEKALDRALEETLGAQGPLLRGLLAAHPPQGSTMPSSEAALLWLHQSLPALGERIHSRTGELYRTSLPD